LLGEGLVLDAAQGRLSLRYSAMGTGMTKGHGY